MKLTKTLLTLVLAMIPMVASADLLDGITTTVDQIIGNGAPAAPVPEPSGALVMGAALAVVALATRRRRT